MKRLTLLKLLCLLSLLSVSVIRAQESSRLQVVATTTLIADVARNVGGDLVDVTPIIPAGTDSHTFVPSPRDIAIIADADVVLMNGLFLEESILPILEANARVEPVVVSYGVPVLSTEHHHDDEDDHGDEDETHEHHVFEYAGVLGVDAACGIDDHSEDDHDGDHDEDDQNEDNHEHGRCDPHVWMDPANVIVWANNIAETFAAADAANAETYRANASAYIMELEALQAEIEAMIDAVPEERRVLVTNHDFLAYFAAAYDFEIVGTVIPGISTLADVDPQTLAGLVEVIREENVPAIFAEVSASQVLAETVAAEVGFDVAVVTLYSESLSPADGPASTYIDYMRYNVGAITGALGG